MPTPDLPIVTVDVSLTIAPPIQVAGYAVLRNKTAEEIEVYARAHPRVFVFPFATKSVEECPDYSSLQPPDEPEIEPSWRDYVLVPMYVGNFDDPEAAIKQIIDYWMVDYPGKLVDDL